MLKDLKLALEAAASVDAETPMAARAGELYEQFVNGEGATLDFSGIIKMLKG
jgi:3-hydroxyisobutyrate dehydrogenase